MTQKELYVFHTLLKWYKCEWRPDDYNHYKEIFNWAYTLVEKEAAEKQRPILSQTFKSIPLLTAEDIQDIINPSKGENAETSLFIGILLIFTLNFSIFSRNASHISLEKLNGCVTKMDKLIFLITHEGFEEMLEN